MITRSDRFRACLLGGAVGHALGAPVKSASLSQIIEQYGPDGITTCCPGFDRTGTISVDTQMTLFIAEGLLGAKKRPDADPLVEIRQACGPWLTTQGEDTPATEEASLHRPAQRDASDGGLRAGGIGTADRTTNDSEAGGGGMRVAPIGLVADDPFRLAADTAALTHGRPSGVLAAGALAELISDLVAGLALADAVAQTRARTAAEPDSGRVVDSIDEAVALAGQGPGTMGAVETLGQGWSAEEALGMSIYCALVATDFTNGLVLAVNHGGDSHHTGAITGNILGTLLGERAIPVDWLTPLEGHQAIAHMADLLVSEFAD